MTILSCLREGPMLILDQVVDCAEGRIGVIALGSPATGNTLTPSIADQILDRLDAWADDPHIALVILYGTGDRGFCCGVDTYSLNEAISRHDLRSTANYLSHPQTLVHRLNQFPKPVIGWAHGAVSGAGVGLLAACRYRLATPSLSLSLPELPMGMVPYGGASWYLNRLTEGMGLFLALTALPLNLTDALHLGLVDRAMPEEGLAPLLDRLRAERWADTGPANDNRLHRLLNQLGPTLAPPLPEPRLAVLEDGVMAAAAERELADIYRALLALSPADAAPWWEPHRTGLERVSPLATQLLAEQLRRGREQGLADNLRMELDLVTQCTQQTDVIEAVNRRISGREDPPAWHHDSLAAVSPEMVNRYFESPWSADDHPLAGL